MAKVTSATVRLVQKKCRANKNGEYPIHIVVCFGGRIEKSTGVSCQEKHWDQKREIIKGQCPNAPVLNKMLQEAKNRVVERRNEFEYAGKRYTAKMLLEEDVAADAKSVVYLDVMERMLAEKVLSDGSRRMYRYAYKRLCDVLKGRFIVDEVTAGVLQQCVKVWQKNGIGDTTCRDIVGRVGSVMHYAVEKRLLPADAHPLLEYKYTQKIRVNKERRTYSIDAANLVKIRDYFLDMVIEYDGNLWHYRPGAEKRLMQRHTTEFALLYWLMCYRMNGSAPADVALLKLENCSRITINGEDYWSIEFKRKKTGVPVHVRMKRDILTIVGFEHYLGTAHLRDGYVYPILQNNEHTMAARTDHSAVVASQKCTCEGIKKVRKCLTDINARTIEENVSTGLKTPLIDVDQVVYYTARHSLANGLLQSPGVSVRDLASVMSRSPNSISTYIHALTRDEDIAEVTKNMAI